MAAPKWKTKDQKEEYLARLSELNLKRWTQARMAQELGVSTRQIKRDLKIIRQRWQETQVANVGTRCAREIAKIDLVEREAWDAWDKSKQDAETRTERIRKGKASGPGNSVEVSIRTEGQAGDATYLKTVLDCIERRCKLLGLDAPEKHIYDIQDLQDLTDEDLAEIVRLGADDGRG